MQQQLAPAPGTCAAGLAPSGPAAQPDTRALRLLARGDPEQTVMLKRADLAWLLTLLGPGEAVTASPACFDPDRPLHPPIGREPNGCLAWCP